MKTPREGEEGPLPQPAGAGSPTPAELRVQATWARVGLGRTGAAIVTRDQLAFQLDHALARDAVHTQMDGKALLRGLAGRQRQAMLLESAASEAARTPNRNRYLQRPDLGRRLSGDSAGRLRGCAGEACEEAEIAFVIADGLCAVAVERHALPLLDAVWSLLGTGGRPRAPVCVVRDGRVAIGDEIGAILGARLAVVLIGERPGLSAPDSMGIYITWSPRVGRTDAERECISNIRPGGIGYAEAASRLVSLMGRALQMRRTGVGLGRPEALPGPAAR